MCEHRRAIELDNPEHGSIALTVDVEALEWSALDRASATVVRWCVDCGALGVQDYTDPIEWYEARRPYAPKDGKEPFR